METWTGNMVLLTETEARWEDIFIFIYVADFMCEPFVTVVVFVMHREIDGFI